MKLIVMIAVATAALALGSSAPLAEGSSHVAVAAPTAQASAYGCWYWNPFTIGGYRLATGGYCVNIDGSSTYVRWVGGGFKSAGNVCNWRITAEFFDYNGQWYQTLNGATHFGCAHSGTDVIAINAWKKKGKMCSTLKTNGSRITSVCHNIY